ncbi:hypothetical protein [Saccharibacillus sp. JS10]|uniref:hypothetical protein n=1 Tax=Saccharibacillus sp. JS10 TaxID=2950552 RepID=UPI00210AB3A1|nr:hypothetical protein [Saccharibacillus sp. JS10]MCQ4087346.1 hypothetical protein [Saccharibacillus sp. JS10]
MTIRLVFPANEKAKDYCLWIAEVMQSEFGISKKEAVDRINSFWRRNDLTDDDNIMYHEGPDFWAYQIYCKDTFWWNMKKEELTPRKYEVL